MRQLHVVKFNDGNAPRRFIWWWRPRCPPQIERMPTPTTSPGVGKTIYRRRASTMPVRDQFLGRPRDEKLIHAIVRHVILHTGGQLPLPVYRVGLLGSYLREGGEQPHECLRLQSWRRRFRCVMRAGVHVGVGGRMLHHIMVSMLRLGEDGAPHGRLWREEGGVLRSIRIESTTRRAKGVESGGACWWSDRRLLFSAM